MIRLLVLIGLTSALRLDNYEVRTVPQPPSIQVDVFAAHTLVYSWMINGTVTGYYMSSVTRMPSVVHTLGTGICPPYTIVKWKSEEPAILGAGCNHQGTMVLRRGNSTELLPITGNFSMIRYDYVKEMVYTLTNVTIKGYGTSNYELRRIINMKKPIRDFYVGNSLLFYTRGSLYAYDGVNAEKATNQPFLLDGTQLRAYYVANSATHLLCAHTILIVTTLIIGNY